MHVRVRTFGKKDVIVVVESKLTKIEQFRRIVKDKLGVDVSRQRLFYGGKLLEDGYTFHDYNIKLNDVIQLMPKLQSADHDETQDLPSKSNTDKEGDKKDENNVVYKDAISGFYEIGDLIDMRDREQGAWFEGKIVRIVFDPNAPPRAPVEDDMNVTDAASDKESDSENKPPSVSSSQESPPKSKPKGIAKYFSKAVPKKQISEKDVRTSGGDISRKLHDDILYKIQLDGDEEDSDMLCKFIEIRPRARKEIPIEDLKPGMTIMVNHNEEDLMEKGYWYDFTVNEINKLRTSHELVGTLYLGPDAIPQNDTKIRVIDKIYAIEEVIPMAQRTEEYKKMMVTPTDKRSCPLNCLKCRDDEDELCKWCGCFLCAGKENPEKIVLCDECNNGYHMECLSPPLTALPEEDWYCPSCKRDTRGVIAPGAAKQTKKTSKSKRDWGRGMACVGKSKTCAMPANHFGPIPGIEVGMSWRFRMQLSETGVHRPPVSGIHGRDVEGAYSIVLSGGYEDDVDHGKEFTYTGSGGRDLSGNKRTAGQSCDQTLTRENKALARNCAVKKISKEGADSGENWRDGKPVRVVRSYKMLKHFPKYAPKEGIRYDGIYKVVKYYPEKGLSGFRVWKYFLRRDDPIPPPWAPGAKQFPIIYPDGYLEAEAEKRAQKQKNSGSIPKKGKKRTLLESNKSIDKSESVSSPPSKKLRSSEQNMPNPKKRGRPPTNLVKSPLTPVVKLVDIFKKMAKSDNSNKLGQLTANEEEAIKSDVLNEKLWNECLKVCEKKGKKEFVEHVTEVFLCIICQEVAANPVTTPCLHNFCMGCLKLAFKSTSSQSCPCCRNSLAKYEPTHNKPLRSALQAILPGYDVGKK